MQKQLNEQVEKKEKKGNSLPSQANISKANLKAEFDQEELPWTSCPLQEPVLS